MTALAADRVTKTKGPLRRQEYPVAATAVIYCGGMVCINATGYAVPAANTAGLSDVKGIATAKADNSAGADGAITVVVEYDGAFLLDVGAGITQADVGRGAFVTDDQTVTDISAATSDIYVGEILAYLDEAQDKAWVNVLGARSAKVTHAVSTELTGTGAEQSFAHGLGAIPATVLAVLTEFADTLAVDVAYGTHDATNAKVTVTSGAKFKLLVLL